MGFDAEHTRDESEDCGGTGSRDESNSQKHFYVTTIDNLQTDYDQEDGQMEHVNVHQLWEELVSSMNSSRKYIYRGYIHEIAQTDKETFECLHKLYGEEDVGFDEAPVQTSRIEDKYMAAEALDYAIPVTESQKMRKKKKKK